MLQQAAITYDNVRRYADEEAVLDRVLAIGQMTSRESRGERCWNWTGRLIPTLCIK